MKRPLSLIITGNGLNCEAETSYAYERAKAEPKLVHIYDLIDGDSTIDRADILTFIGGFADGDDLSAGTVQAARFRWKLRDSLEKFISADKPVIGICNGYQTLVKMGVLPGFDGDYQSREVTLMANDSAKFEDRWVNLSVNHQSPCIWTEGIKQMFLPVRHGEGKLYGSDTVIKRLVSFNQAVMFYTDGKNGKYTMDYPANPNGSLEAIAGICDPTGHILGLMPHPEAFLSPYNHPEWTFLRDTGKRLPKHGQGLKIFENAVRYVNGL
jgi:phosphoribosylformylglycinamidine synthase subunit PurQ / glutaminase